MRFKDDLSVGLHRKTKTAGVRRHQSLIVPPTHKKTFDDVVIDSNNPLNDVQTRISSLLSDKRVRAGRSEDIKVSIYMYTHTQKYVHTKKPTHKYAHTHTYKPTHKATHTHTRTRVHVHTQIYIHTYMYIYFLILS